VTSVAWSPDGTTVASGSGDNTVRLWNAATGDDEEGGGEDDVDDAGDAEGIVVLGTVRRISLVSADSTLPLMTSVAWSGSNDVVTGGGIIQLWTIHSEDEIRLKDLVELNGHVSVACAGTKIVAGHRKGVHVWDIDRGGTIKQTFGPLVPANRSYSVALSPDGTKVASATTKSAIRIWDTNTGRVTTVMTGHTKIVTSVSWSPDGTKIVSGCNDKTVRVWNMQGNIVWTRALTRSPFTVSWSPDGKFIAISYGTLVGVVNAATGSSIVGLKNHTGDVSVAWSPDSTKIVSGDNHLIRVWSWRNGTVDMERESPSRVKSVAWSPDGKKIVWCEHKTAWMLGV
jgi:WD40 repeat protein